MAWKLDDIDFSTYGVGVRKATGVLDLPKIVDKGHDFLELDSVYFWQDAADLRYNDDEIVLKCWIKADSYTAFKTAVNTFYTALQGSDLRTLETPFGTSIDCYLEKKIEMSRKTPYLAQYQIGLFTLTLTVPGDADYNLITFKRWTSEEGVTYPAVVKTKDCKISKTLQGDISMSMSFESNEILDIKSGDYIDYEYPGSDGNTDRFIVIGAPSFDKESTNKYSYSLTLKFLAIDFLERTQFLNDLGESDFSGYFDLEELLDLIISNNDRFYGNHFTKGTVASTIQKNHTFSKENCYSVLQRMCEEYELEYEIVKNDPNWWEYTINIKEQVANDLEVTLQYGKNNGQYNLKSGELIDDDFFSVLYAFGSTKNLPTGYRSGLQRLSFDDNPLSQIPDSSLYKEQTIYFDDIYPSRTGTITAYEQVLEDDLSSAQKETYPNGIFKITDTSLEFDLNAEWEDTDEDYAEYLQFHDEVTREDYIDSVVGDTKYLIDGTTAQIVMKSGDLAGYEFDISLYDNDTQTFIIIPFEESDGTILPNATLLPAVGDEYTLVNINLPASYIEDAETDLYNEAVDALAEGSSEQYEYTAKIDPKFMIDNTIFLEVGDRLTLIDTDMGLHGTFRIQSLTFNDYTRIYELTFSEKKNLARLAYLEKSVNTLTRAAESTGTSEVETIRDSNLTVGELKRRLLGTDGKLNESVFRSNSIDPGALALDVETTFYLKDALVELNYGDDEDAVKVYAGEITITNYDTLSRYDIAKLKSAGSTYDPTRTWIVPETELTLATKDAYVLYLKLDLTEGSTACTVVASADHIEGKELISDGYLYKRFFTISSGEEASA